LAPPAQPPAFVAPQVDPHSPALLDDRLERLVELGTAVAPVAAEHVAGEALAVDAGAPGPASAEVAVHERDVFTVVDRDLVAVGLEVAELGRQQGLRDPLD